MRIVSTALAVMTLLVIAHADAAAVDAAYAAQADVHPGLVTRVVYGQSRGGRDLVAYRVGNSGPAVLYTAAQDGGCKRSFVRTTYKRSGTVTLKLSKAGRRATVLRLRLYRGSGRGARLIDTTTVKLRRA